MPLLMHHRIRIVALAVAWGLSASTSPLWGQSAVTPGIMAVQENGRTVFVNAPPPERPRARARVSMLVYWSNTEHRWKPVPPPNPILLQSARTAAAEVAGFVASRPRGMSLAAGNPNYAAMARGYRVSTAQIDQAIDDAARKHNVDPNLVRALIKVESGFNPNAVSHKGAMGLMQLMPDTARSLKVTDPFDPQQNVDAGVRHLKQLLTDFHGDVTLTLAAYNAGAGAVTRNRGVPPYAETQNYVKRITRLVGDSPGTTTIGSSGAPVHMYRGEDGVMRMTNTE